jgi:hypothetical protein
LVELREVVEPFVQGEQVRHRPNTTSFV